MYAVSARVISVVVTAGVDEEISMLNIRMSRTPIEGSPVPGVQKFDAQASPHFDVVEVRPRNYQVPS